MKIEIIPYKDSYAFRLREDGGKIVFSSFRDHFVIPFVQERYSFASDAKVDAVKLLRRDYHLKALKQAKYEYEPLVPTEVSAEEMMETHYMNLLSSMETKIRGDKGNSKLEKEDMSAMDMIEEEIIALIGNSDDKKAKRKLKSILNGFKRLRRKNFGDKKAKVTASASLDKDILEDLLMDYGESACKAIRECHPGSFPLVEINGKDGGVWIVESNKGDTYKALFRIDVNRRLNVNSIIPCGSLAKIYPIHSIEFYQKYWKPIVEGIGHFYLDDNSMLIVPSDNELPDIPRGEGTFSIEGWNTLKDRLDKVDISFRGKKPIWIFEASKTKKTASIQNPSKYTEQEYLNAIVKCVDPLLESIHGRTGAVIQVIPLADHIEVDVDFGRGLDVVRLSEQQLQIVQ